MDEQPADRETLRCAFEFAASQAGGTLATAHSEDGTPYVTYVLAHMLPGGEVLFGSPGEPQHVRNMQATPEVSFLWDNREVISAAPDSFTRCVVEGRAAPVPPGDPRYAVWLGALRQKAEIAARFAEQGSLFVVLPRRVIYQAGFRGPRETVEVDAEV